MLPRTSALLGIALILAPVPSAPARQEAAKAGPKRAEHGESLSKTRHSVTVGDRKLEYEATAGTLTLHDDDGKALANVFFVAYETVGENRSRRPVTFAFNGGPGSSAAWLHLGAFGPRRVDLGESGRETAPPYHLVENDGTLLDLTDLVFIDPVSTGFSRPVNPQEAKQFHSTEGDVRSIASFVRLYLTRFDRWDSPKYIAGESYGTTRAAALAEALQEQHGIYLNGVILLSVVLNFETISSEDGNDLPYPLFLPSFTATAWFHKRLPSELQADLGRALDEVERFALRDYSSALMRGSDLSQDERQELAKKLARYTGLPAEYVLRSDFRVDASRFRKELLRDRGRTVGRYDSRYEGPDLDAVGSRPDYDPSYPVVQGPFTALINSYLRDSLKYETELDYQVLTGKVHPWDFGAKNHYLNTGPALRQAMTKSPALRVFVASGRYDLATPAAATRYTFNHLGLDPAQRGRVTLMDYPAGHMMYIEAESRHRLKADLTGFYHNGARAEGAGR